MTSAGSTHREVYFTMWEVVRGQSRLALHEAVEEFETQRVISRVGVKNPTKDPGS